MKLNIGLQTHGVLGYLAAIGLTAHINEELDPEATTKFEFGHLVLETKYTADDVCSYLANNLTPAGIIAPWQANNGIWKSDGKSSRALSAISVSKDPRAKRLQEAHKITMQALSELNLQPGSSRPGYETIQSIRQHLAAMPQDTDINTYARLINDGTSHLIGIRGRNGRHSYSGHHIILAGRLLQISGVKMRNDNARCWAENIIKHSNCGLGDKVNYSGWCPQNGTMSGTGPDSKIGNPLYPILAMKGLIATNYVPLYTDLKSFICPVWNESMTIESLRLWIDKECSPSYITHGLKSIGDNTIQLLKRTGAFLVGRYENGFSGRGAIHCRPLGFVDKLSAYATLPINYAKIWGAPNNRNRCTVHNIRKIIVDKKNDTRIKHIVIEELPEGTQELKEETVLVRRYYTDNNAAIECYIVKAHRPGNIEKIGEWRLSTHQSEQFARPLGRQLLSLARTHLRQTRHTLIEYQE